VEYPKLGRVGRKKGTRELVINRTSFIVVYLVDGDLVRIFRFLHGAQKWP
jgi:toxin ParE1/3/4